MAYTFKAQKIDDYILVTASGTIDSVDDLATLSKSLRETAGRFNCRRFLVDERAVVKNIDSHDLTVFADSRMDEPHRLRLAVICSPEDVSRLHWMETIQQNRSLSYKHFSTFEEAREWLLS